MRLHWERCDNCQWFTHRGDIGECRAGGPAVPTVTYAGMWPQVAADDCCGRFAFDPTGLYAEIERLESIIDRMERERGDAAGQTDARVSLPVVHNTTGGE